MVKGKQQKAANTLCTASFPHFLKVTQQVWSTQWHQDTLKGRFFGCFGTSLVCTEFANGVHNCCDVLQRQLPNRARFSIRSGPSITAILQIAIWSLALVLQGCVAQMHEHSVCPSYVLIMMTQHSNNTTTSLLQPSSSHSFMCCRHFPTEQLREREK